jgi:glycosyltransferase involved in cell wall biosynthesis
MNILMLDQFSDPGGAQQVLAELLPEMARCGWKGAVALPGNGELFERARDAGFGTAHLPMGLYRAGRKSAADVARFLVDTPQVARRIRALAEEIRADLIYVNGPRLLPATAWARTGRPVVFHSHSYLAPGVLRELAGFSLERVNAHVIAQCDFVAGQWWRFVPSDRVSVVYNGVAGPQCVRARRVGGPPRIGCIGRIAPEKGQHEFIKAAARIHEAMPECRFAIYGSALFGDAASAKYSAVVRRQAQGLPIAFAGWVQNVYSAMADLDLLLVPCGPHEATTRVIPEAFAAGVPVIAFASGGIPELIENGGNGLLARDAADMAELAIVLLTGDPRRLITISRSARETWERRFMLERFHRELLRRIEAVVGIRVPAGMGR